MVQFKESMSGIFTAPITPFDDKNRINENVLKTLMHKNITEGVAGFFVGGSSGECFLLSTDERIELLNMANRYKKDKKMIAHIGAIATDEAILYGKVAKELDYDAIAATVPYYYKFSNQCVAKYYYDLYEAVGMPIIVYNFPCNTGFEFNLQDQIIVELFKSDAILGVKHTNLNLYQMERIKNINPNLIMYNGFDEVMISGMAIGADGAIGSTFNVMYGHYKKIQNAFVSRNAEEALRLQVKANNIMEAFCLVGLIPAIKYILTTQGVSAGIPRRPFQPLDSDAQQYILKVWNDNIC